jgi:hypothetical protein
VIENEPRLIDHLELKIEIGGVAARVLKKRTEKQSFSAHRGAEPEEASCSGRDLAELAGISFDQKARFSSR